MAASRGGARRVASAALVSWLGVSGVARHRSSRRRRVGWRPQLAAYRGVSLAAASSAAGGGGAASALLSSSSLGAQRSGGAGGAGGGAAARSLARLIGIACGGKRCS